MEAPIDLIRNIEDDLTVIILGSSTLAEVAEEDNADVQFLRDIQAAGQRAAFGVQMLAKRISTTLREIAPAATPTTCATKTVIEGDVTRSAAGALQIEGSVDQDDARLGMTWPNSPIHAETTISSEIHLSCYEGARVRITVERL